MSRITRWISVAISVLSCAFTGRGCAMLAAHGQSLASDSEALPESSKTCAIETEEIPTSERIQRLCNLKKYDEALALCNVYEVDPVSGKPFYGDSRHANIGGPHLLRSKILLASGRREECIEEARLACISRIFGRSEVGPCEKIFGKSACRCSGKNVFQHKQEPRGSRCGGQASGLRSVSITKRP